MSLSLWATGRSISTIDAYIQNATIDSATISQLTVSTLSASTLDSIAISTTTLFIRDKLIIATAQPVTIKTSNVSTPYTIQLPTTQGLSTQVLTTSGTQWYWATPLASVAISAPSFLTAGPPVTAPGGTITLDYSGIPIPIANGGTGTSTSTGSGSLVLSSSPTLLNPVVGAVLQIKNNASKTVTLNPFHAAADYNLMLPASAGTPGQLLAYGNPMTWITLKLDQGYWTPTFRYVTNAGVIDPADEIINLTQSGYYNRVGASVTVFFSINFDIFINNPGPTNTYRYAAIGNLPYPIGVAGVAEISCSSQLSDASWPNGTTGGGLIPSVGVPTFSGNYTASAYESGTEVPLYINAVANFPNGTWEADGYHLMIYADCAVYTASVTVPPWTNISTTNTPLNTFHVVNRVLHSNCGFSGTITYLSDA